MSPPARRFWAGLALAVVLLAVLVAISGLWRDLATAGTGTLRALWTLPLLIALHLVQLLFSARAWRGLLAAPGPGLGAFFGLRLMREGLNSLLPVAHVGGEVVAIRLLTRRGIAAARGTASVIVDVTLEVCAQVAVLMAGLLALGWVAGASTAWLWPGTVAGAVLAACGLLAAQRFGLLRLLESAVRAIGRRWPGLAAGGLDGLNAEVGTIYRRPARLVEGFLLQATAWTLGAAETWLVLQALGVDASPAQAFAVESLGAAARSAGFAVPGALAIQETGYVLAAAACGLPELPALSLSLVKRIREILIGIAGLVAWRVLGATPTPPAAGQPLPAAGQPLPGAGQLRPVIERAE